jgi:hypothetical protein
VNDSTYRLTTNVYLVPVRQDTDDLCLSHRFLRASFALENLHNEDVCQRFVGIALASMLFLSVIAEERFKVAAVCRSKPKGYSVVFVCE